MATSRLLDSIAALPRPLLQALTQQGLSTVGELLTYNALDLCEMLDITYSQALLLLRTVSAEVTPAFKTAAVLLKEARAPGRLRLASGLPALDAALGAAGLPCGALTELVGPSGAGKSQMCLTMALRVAAPPPWGLQRSVIYVDTEGKFSTPRLVEMVKAGLSQPPGGPASAAPGADEVDEEVLKLVLGRVLLVRPLTADELRHCLHSLPAQVAQHSAGLVVIDSLAALARLEYSGSKSSLLSRQELLGSTTALLKTLADACSIPVLLTNQVTSRPTGAPTATTHDFQAGTPAGGGVPGPAAAGQHSLAAHQPGQPASWHGLSGGLGDGGGLAAGADAGYVTAALGTLWAHSVNLRLVLERLGERRVMRLVKAPASAEVGLEYAILPAGVRQVMGATPTHAQAGSVLGAAIANQVDWG